MKKILSLFIAASLCMIVFAQETPPADTKKDMGFKFAAGLTLGGDIFPDKSGNNNSWTVLSFQPEFIFGPFGFGFDLGLRFRLMPSSSPFIIINKADWIPNYEGSGKNIFDLYLPKLLYIRYGQKGEPLYVKFGSINDLTLGSGFVVRDYSNMAFLPRERLFGLDFGFDSNLFNFPYIGLEFLTGNLAKFDVFGIRLYTRPLAFLNVPIIKDTQLGGSFVMDRGVRGPASPQSFKPVMAYGTDIVVPILGGGLFPLSVFTELAFQQNSRLGFMTGLRGRLGGIFIYEAQFRVLSKGFIPEYFDTNYDLYRVSKAAALAVPSSAPVKMGWFAKMGLSAFTDAVVFYISMSGPAKAAPAVPSLNSGDYPQLRAVFSTKPDLLGGFFVTASYDKYFLGRTKSFWNDLISPSDAVIGATVNYKKGPAIFTLLYSLRYNPLMPSGYEINTSMQTTIRF